MQFFVPAAVMIHPQMIDLAAPVHPLKLQPQAIEFFCIAQRNTGDGTVAGNTAAQFFLVEGEFHCRHCL